MEITFEKKHMEKGKIEEKMHELETKIQFRFEKIDWLSKAMESIRIEVSGQGKNGSEHSNEMLATVGDAVLKAIIADKLYKDDNIHTKGDITKTKSRLERNKTMHRLMIDEGLIAYSYNEYHFCKDPDVKKHQQVVCKKHDPYIEAIVGAVYFDSGYEKTKKWVLQWLLPLLEKYADKTEAEAADNNCS